MVIIEDILIGYAICLTRKAKVRQKTPEESPDDQTITIPRNLPNFTITVKDDDPFAEDFNSEGSLEVSDDYFLGMEEK